MRFFEMCLLNSQIKHENPVKNDTICIFDIDYCLYSSDEMHEMEKRLVKDDALKYCTESEWNGLVEKYQSTKELFYYEFGMSISDFHEKYENPDIAEYLKPNEYLNEILKSLKCRKFCFTNGSKTRAKNILRYLELEEFIEAVICSADYTEENNFILKPNPASFEFVENFLSISDATKIFFFDDKQSIVNQAILKGWNAFKVENNLIDVLLELIQQNKIF